MNDNETKIMQFLKDKKKTYEWEVSQSQQTERVIQSKAKLEVVEELLELVKQ